MGIEGVGGWMPFEAPACWRSSTVEPSVAETAAIIIALRDPERLRRPGVVLSDGLVPKELTSRHYFNEGKLVPITSFQVDGDMGVGVVTGQGVTPMMMMQFSIDGGKNFGSEIFVPMGRIGDDLNRARITRLGSARDWVIRLAITDPVKRIITGVFINKP